MKKLLAIVVLGLLWSGNAYALKFEKCHRYKEKHDEKVFNKSDYERHYYTLFLKKMRLRDVVIFKDEFLKKLNKKEQLFSKINQNFRKITFINEDYIETQFRTFNIKTGVISFKNPQRPDLICKVNTKGTSGESGSLLKSILKSIN